MFSNQRPLLQVKLAFCASERESTQGAANNTCTHGEKLECSCSKQGLGWLNHRMHVYTYTEKVTFLQVILLTFGWCFTFIIHVSLQSPTFKLSTPTVTLATKTAWPTLSRSCHTKGCGSAERVLKKRGHCMVIYFLKLQQNPETISRLDTVCCVYIVKREMTYIIYEVKSRWKKYGTKIHFQILTLSALEC